MRKHKKCDVASKFEEFNVVVRTKKGNVASQSSYPQTEPVLWEKLANWGPHNDDPYLLGRNQRRKDEKSQDDVAVRQHDFKISSFRIIQYVFNPKCFLLCICHLPSTNFKPTRSA